MTRAMFEADRRLLEKLSEPIVADVRRTLDSEYRLSYHYADARWEWRSRWSISPGLTAASVPERVFNEDECQATITLVQAILDFDFDDVQEPWPRCSIHHNHPLQLGCSGTGVWWFCTRDSVPLAPLGGFQADSMGRPG